jgi:protein TonB
VDIPFSFPAPGATEPRIVAAPYWLSGFDPAQALKIFPREAAEKGLSTGLGVAECLVTRDGGLTQCAPMPADPEQLGFSEAAVTLAASLRMNPWQRDGEPVDGATVRVAIRLNLKSGP